jgi:hypothetical protein
MGKRQGLVFMQKETAQKLVLVIVGLFIGLLAAESFVRWRGAYDEDGNFTFQANTLKPYRLPPALARSSGGWGRRLAATPPFSCFKFAF